MNPLLHKSDRDHFSYGAVSTAHIPLGKGDFYYAGGFFSGAVGEVHDLVKAYRANLEADRVVNVEARWQEESHVNRYLLTNKPTSCVPLGRGAGRWRGREPGDPLHHGE
ncbi:unnamed protein product [Lota lota]